MVYLAASEDMVDKSLDYFFMLERKDMDEKTKNEANGKKLWELSEKLLNEKGISFNKSI